MSLSQQQQDQIKLIGEGLQVLQQDFMRLLRDLKDPSPTPLSGARTGPGPSAASAPLVASAPKDVLDWMTRAGFKFENMPHPALRTEAAMLRLNESITETMRNLIEEYDVSQSINGNTQAPMVSTPPTVNPTAPVTQAPPKMGPQTTVETEDEKAAKAKVLLEEDLMNLKRTIQNAFSSTIDPNFRGTYQWQADNSDNFDADIFSQQKQTIVNWPEGFYRDAATKSLQYRGTTAEFVFLLDFSERHGELCYIAFPKLNDNIIAAWSSFGEEPRRLFTHAIWEALKSKVIPK